MSYLFGAIARGDAAATIEHNAGSYLIACVRGRLATPALETIKAAFYRLVKVDAGAARTVCAAAPSMIADAVAVVLIAGEHVHIACAGDAVVLRQRGAVTTRVDGSHHLEGGDDLIASSAPLTIAGTFFATSATARDHEFRHDSIDADLGVAAAAVMPAGTVAIAALRCTAASPGRRIE